MSVLSVVKITNIAKPQSTDGTTAPRVKDTAPGGVNVLNPVVRTKKVSSKEHTPTATLTMTTGTIAV